MQDFHEYPLLHDADLMLALLRAGSEGNGSFDMAVDRLRRDLDIAGECPPFTTDDIRAELAAAFRNLEQAQLVERTGDTFHTTERGRRILADHPLGIDATVLMQFSEYRAQVSPATPAATSSAETRAYQRGFAGFLAGRSHADNPHRPDTVMHLAWENGWFEARDALGPWSSTGHSIPRPERE